MLLRRLGVRNKSNTVGLVCAASSSSCMIAFKPFNNNNKYISLADIVPGIEMNTGTQEDRRDTFFFFVIQQMTHAITCVNVI